MPQKKSFNELGLSESLLEAVNSKGFEEPTSIQEMTIPVMLRDETDIIAQAQTGTGKTAAFGLPLLEMIEPGSGSVQAVILVPTRELAVQVSEEINSFKKGKPLRIVPIYGGQSITQQLRSLKKGVDIVVGSPGRVIDHLNRKTLKLNNIRHLILDEADEMLNMGFIDDIEKIMKFTNKDKRTLLFSATMPKKIKDLSGKYMGDHVMLKDKNKQLASNLTEQIYFEVKPSDRFEALCRIIDIEDDFYGLIFCRTKNDVDEVVAHLKSRGYDAELIHGDVSQSQRESTLQKFKKQSINILVATDVAARGIDVNNMSHVINYSLPQDPESYVHRIGRTGRAGNKGTAITFISPSEYKKMMFIQKVAKTDIKKSVLPGVNDIIKSKKKKILEDLSEILKGEVDTLYTEWAEKIIDDNEPDRVMGALLKYCFENELDPDTYSEINKPDKRRNIDQQGRARLFVALGKKDNLNPSKLVDLISGRVDIRSKEINNIQVMDKFSFVTVPFEKAEEIVRSFRDKGERPLISHAKNKQDGKSRKKGGKKGR